MKSISLIQQIESPNGKSCYYFTYAAAGGRVIFVDDLEQPLEQLRNIIEDVKPEVVLLCHG